ncbi:MAG TPA: aminoglycoside phosphotransferase family protein [Myxococcota bacterium]|nr:aminoglycoside phosphotransferase family protein [Myxococcota bacterium]
MPREIEEVESLLAVGAPRLVGEPIEERSWSEEKTVWSIGHDHVVRRANAAWVRPLFLREHRLLHYLHGRVSLGIPAPVFVEPGGAFDVLRKAPGEPILYTDWERLDPASQERVARQFGRFLAELHAALPFATASALGFERGFWPPSARWVEERLRERLDTPARRSLLVDLLRIAPSLHAEALEPVLLHDDFSHHNAGFADAGRRVVGAFDFTQARIGDPHRDLRYAYTFEPFAEAMIREYEVKRGVGLDRNRLRALHTWSALGFLAWELCEGDPARIPMRWGWVDLVAAWPRDFLRLASR